MNEEEDEMLNQVARREDLATDEVAGPERLGMRADEQIP